MRTLYTIIGFFAAQFTVGDANGDPSGWYTNSAGFRVQTFSYSKGQMLYFAAVTFAFFLIGAKVRRGILKKNAKADEMELTAGPEKSAFLLQQEAEDKRSGRGFVYFVLILLSLFVAAPMAFVIVWITTGSVGSGFKVASMIGGLTILLGLSGSAIRKHARSGLAHSPEMIEHRKRDEEDYERASEEHNVRIKEVNQRKEHLTKLSASLLLNNVRDSKEFLIPIRRLIGNEECLYLAQGKRRGTATGALVAVTPTRLISDLGGSRIVPLSSIQRIFQDEMGCVHVVSPLEEFTFSFVSGGTWDQLLEVVEAGRTGARPESD